jgi:TOTE conflict system, Archaeo-Eukaryotic Primase domain
VNSVFRLREDLTPDLLERWRARFVNRAIPYGQQRLDGAYRWIYEPCTLELLAGHLCGEVTLALSSTDARSAARWGCLDVDAPGMLPQLLRLRSALADLGMPGLVEASRRSGHLWFFFDRPLLAVAARFAIAKALTVAQAQGVEVPAHECYPDLVGPGAIGHAMRLPLGTHRKTGHRYPLFDAQGTLCAFTTLGRAVAAVLATPLLSAASAEAQWNHYRADSRVYAPGCSTASSTTSSMASGVTTDVTAHDEELAQRQRHTMDTRSAVIRWVDREISPLDLLAELAPGSELKRVGQGYLGWCPFHDDRAADANGALGTPSFYVVDNRRYGWSWRCLSSNCAHAEGPMRHSFRLLQELLGLDVVEAIGVALTHWPEARRSDTLERKDEGDANTTDDCAAD